MKQAQPSHIILLPRSAQDKINCKQETILKEMFCSKKGRKKKIKEMNILPEVSVPQTVFQQQGASTVVHPKQHPLHTCKTRSFYRPKNFKYSVSITTRI
jgi:hypothetical protein